MSYISDFKSSTIALFGQGTSTSSGTGSVVPEMASMTGARFDLEDGREVRLISNAATALTSGVLVQGASITLLHQNLTVAVPAATPATAGLFQISCTIGATKINVNEYAGGFLVVNAGTGIGQTLKIASNVGASASGVGVIITTEDPIQVTLDATSKISLFRNPYDNCVINTVAASAVPVGVTLYPVSASTATTYTSAGALTTTGVFQYAFVVSKGVTSLLADATLIGIGGGVSPSTTTAGAVTLSAAWMTNIGRAMQTTVSAESRAVFVDL